MAGLHWKTPLAGHRLKLFHRVLLQAALAAAGWESLVVWECALKDEAALLRAVASFLGPPGRVGASGTGRSAAPLTPASASAPPRGTARPR